MRPSLLTTLTTGQSCLSAVYISHSHPGYKSYPLTCYVLAQVPGTGSIALKLKRVSVIPLSSMTIFAIIPPPLWSMEKNNAYLSRRLLSHSCYLSCVSAERRRQKNILFFNHTSSNWFWLSPRNTNVPVNLSNTSSKCIVGQKEEGGS